MAELFIQEIKLGSNVVTVMGDSSEELAEKVMAAMLVYHQAGYLPKKLPTRVVHKSKSRAGIVPHHALRPGRLNYLGSIFSFTWVMWRLSVVNWAKIISQIVTCQQS